jgi:predicted metalloendopeptidase
MAIRLPALAFAAAAAAWTVAAGHGQAPGAPGSDPVAPHARPQDDLYEHVNHAWLARTDIPPDRVTYDAFAELSDKVEADVHGIIQALSAEGADADDDVRRVVDLYHSVTDEATLDGQGSAPLRPQLDRIAAIDSARDLAREIGRLSSLAAGGPFAGTVVTDPNNPRRLLAQIGQGGTLLPEREHYVAAHPRAVEVRTRYRGYLVTLFRLLDHASPEADADRVLALETELAKVQWSAAESRDGARTANRFSFSRLAREMPGFDWWAWGEPQGLTTSGAVILMQPSFFKAFAAMIETVPLDTWRLWLTIRYVTFAAPYVSNAFGDARFEFFGRYLTGQQAPRPRWKRGVGLVNGNLGDAVGRLYVERYFPEPSKRRAESLVQGMRAALREALASAGWLEPATRRAALEKLDELRFRVGYPDAWRTYGRFKVRRDDLLGNVMRAQQFEHRLQLERARGRQDPRFWPVTAQSVNAFYNPSGNEIVLPAALLQPPFFDPAGDDATNYGAIGGIVGHELAHAFDLRGRRFDERGAERDWWRPADERAYVARITGLVAQFNGYAEHGVGVDGQLTVLENAADLAGLSLAYRAYRASRGERPDTTIDGLTADQRFFMGWARVWRAKMRPEYARQALRTQPHAPARFRVNGPVSHLRAFYEAFGVKPGDRLYRPAAQRVEIW